MCDIAGWVGAVDSDEDVLRRMCDAMGPRGPDEHTAHIEEGRAGIGFRRLSIVDLRSGHQALFDEAGRSCVACNGDIYNLRELRAELERLCTPALLDAAGGPRQAWEAVLALPALRGVDRYVALDVVTYLPGDLLVKVDRMSIAHRLEVRSPLHDHHVHGWAARRSWRLKLRHGVLKWPLKELARRRGMPDALVDRPKKGFGVPVGEWFRGELRPWLEDVLFDARSRSRATRACASSTTRFIRPPSSVTTGTTCSRSSASLRPSSPRSWPTTPAGTSTSRPTRRTSRRCSQVDGSCGRRRPG